jgi:predicted nucleotidyltransferase
MTAQAQVAIRRDEILRLASEHGARDVRIFGSVARGQAGPSSDLDLLVRLEPGRSLLDLIALKQDLEDLLGIPVDVVTDAALSPYLRTAILSQAVPI